MLIGRMLRAAASARGATKVYGQGDTEVTALAGVDGPLLPFFNALVEILDLETEGMFLFLEACCESPFSARGTEAVSALTSFCS